MSKSSPDCPSVASLEEIASLDSIPSGFARHLAGCAFCREYIESARFARRFGSVFGEDASQRESVPPSFPDVFGYELIEEIGRGGQGTVYRGIQSASGQVVAIKVVHAPSGGTTPRARARFLREIQISASLNHPGIVRLLDSLLIADGREGIVFEYIDGLPLDEWIDAHPELPGAQRLELLALVADAIQHAHQRGVIHRDLKPSNILMDASGLPHILDFGVARLHQASLGSDRITRTGEFTGTLAYAAPEQVLQDQLVPDVRTDIYALGLIAYRSLTGELPYRVDGSLDSAIRNIVEAEPARQTGAGMSVDHRAVIAKAIAKEPERRYQSASELAADFRAAAAGRAIAARSDHRWYTLRKAVKRHRVWITLLAVILLGLSGTILATLVGNRRLNRTLQASRLQQLHTYIEIDARDRAEEILWSEAKHAIPFGEADERALWSAPLRDRQLRWAFMEMQDRATCLFAEPLGLGSLRIIDPIGAQRFGVVSLDRQIKWLSIAGDHPTLTDGPRLPDSVLVCRFVPSGRFMLTLEPGWIRCVDPTTGEVLRARDISNDAELSGCMSVSEWGAALCSSSGELLVLSVPDLDVLHESDGYPANQRVWMDPAEHTIGVLDSQARIRLIDIAADSIEFPLSQPICDAGTPQLFPEIHIDDERRVLIVALAGRLFLVDLADPRSGIRELSREGYRLHASMNQSGTLVGAQAYGESSLRLWDIRSAEEIMNLPGHDGAVQQHAFSGNGERIVTVDHSGTLRLWATPGNSWREPMVDQPSNTHRLAASRQKNIVLGADDRMRSQLLRLGPFGEQRGAIEFLGFNAVRFAVDEASGLCAASDIENNIRLFSIERSPDDARVVTLAEGDTATGIGFGTLHDGSLRLAICTQRGELILLDPRARTGKPERASLRVGEDLQPSDLVWSPDNRQIACSFRDGRVAIIQPETFEVEQLLSVSASQVRSLAYSPDAQELAAVGDDGRIAFINTATGSIRHSEQLSDSSQFCIAYHPSGGAVVVGDRLGKISVVDAHSGGILAGFRAKGSVMSIAFVSDGDELLVSALGRPLERWSFTNLARTLRALRPDKQGNEAHQG
ncbi:MAG: protein kinase [Phycisphaerales bacterium]|nr:protein kinase [Phycisphaerales bacterium]